MKDDSLKTNTRIKITEVFSGNKTLGELFLKLLLSKQPVIKPDTTKLNV